MNKKNSAKKTEQNFLHSNANDNAVLQPRLAHPVTRFRWQLLPHRFVITFFHSN